MNKLTLCKKIAEIEGIKVSECKGILIRMDLPFGTSLNAMMSLSNAETLNDYKMAQDEYGKAYYDPLTDDALCFQLMKKHDIDNSRGGVRTETGEAVYCAKKHDSNAELVFSRSRNKVILLAIAEANNV